MSEQELRQRLAKNLTEYRRLYEMTQAELAERLNYSDKSISKWERGEGLPDVFVLTQIADLYGITVNDLLSDRTPHKPSATLRVFRRRKHLLITLLAVGLVWLLATICFFFLGLFAPELPRHWLTFIAAIPPSFIVLVVFTNMWFGNWARFLSVSGLVWSIAVLIDVAIVQFPNLYLIYAVAGVFQILIILWYFLILNGKKKGIDHAA